MGCGARLGGVNDVHQCPFCELRFVTVAETQFHIESDHPDRKVPDRANWPHAINDKHA